MRIFTICLAVYMMCSILSYAAPVPVVDLMVKELDGKVRIVLTSNEPFGYFLHERLNDKIIMCEILNSKLAIREGDIPVNKHGIRMVKIAQYKEDPAVVKVIAVLDDAYRYEVEADRNEFHIDIFNLNKKVSADYVPQSEQFADFTASPVIKPSSGGEKVAFDFVDMEIKSIFFSLGQMMDKNIIVDKDVKNEKTDFIMKDITAQEALDIFSTKYNLFLVNYNENTIVVTTKENRAKYVKNKMQHKFKLINIDPELIVSAIKSNAEYAKKIDTNRFIIDNRTRSIIVHESADNISLIGKVIKDLDHKLKQVAIELKIVEMNRTDFTNLGVELGFPLTFGDIRKIKNSEMAISAQLDMLAQKNKAKILSSPKIRVVDGEAGSISVGETVPVPYFTYEDSSKVKVDSNGNTIKTNDDDSLNRPIRKWEQMNFGINLSVKPIIREDNEIEMKLNIAINNLLNLTADGQPHTTTKTTSTFIRTRNGETVVLGGLVNQHESDNVTQTPFLQDIPVLGKIFSHRGKRNINTELVMFITCYLVNNEDETVIASQPSTTETLKSDYIGALNQLKSTVTSN